jgi:hypothetical protein
MALLAMTFPRFRERRGKARPISTRQAPIIRPIEMAPSGKLPSKKIGKEEQFGLR